MLESLLVLPPVSLKIFQLSKLSIIAFLQKKEMDELFKVKGRTKNWDIVYLTSNLGPFFQFITL